MNDSEITALVVKFLAARVDVPVVQAWQSAPELIGRIMFATDWRCRDS